MAKIFSIGWCVLVNLIEVAVVVAMLGVAHTTFEKVVISALVLIYWAVRNSFSLLGKSLLEQGQTDLARYINIAKQLKLDTELHTETYKENEVELEQIKIGSLINLISHGLIFLIAAATLIMAVV